jgi:predicted nucleic acid-binding protein
MYLLDTNVVSELRKVKTGRANPGVAQWALQVDAGALFLSVISLHELELGIQLMERRDAPQGALLRSWLETCVVPAFAERILPVDAAVARRSAGLHVPDPQPLRDGLIAATALEHGLTVVTRNTTDFEASGARLLNPWR